MSGPGGSASPPPVPAPSCTLCGRSPIHPELDEAGSRGVARFCCVGCRNVHRILDAAGLLEAGDPRESAPFQAALALGLIEPAASGPSPLSEAAEETDAGIARRPESPPPESVGFALSGLWCPSCAWLIEGVLRHTPGVVDAEVGFVTGSLRVRYDPVRADPGGIARVVERLGYRISRRAGAHDALQAEHLTRLGVSAFFSANLMMFSVVGFSAAWSPLPAAEARFFPWLMLILSCPAVLWAGLPIYARGFAAFRAGLPNMESLIGLGALLAFAQSLVEMAHGGAVTSFDTAAALVTLTLFGRTVEALVRVGAAGRLGATGRLAPERLNVPRGDGSVRSLEIAQAAAGDRFVVRAGEAVPVDGRIVAGAGDVDESFLTGEARPRRRGEGEPLLAGSLVVSGTLEATVVAIGAGTVLGRIALATDQGLARRAGRIETLADVAARRFVWAAIALAGGTGIWLLARGDPASAAASRAIATLVVSCPCALGLAVPLTLYGAVTSAFERGAVVKDLDAFDRLADVELAVFDKTGTLTEGEPQVCELSLAPGTDSGVATGIGALEDRTHHPVGRALAARLGTREMVWESIRTLPGLGVTGRAEGREWFSGNARLVARLGARVPDAISAALRRALSRGETAVLFGVEGAVSGLAALADRPKSGAADTLAGLRELGVVSTLLSGDNRGAVGLLCESLGIAPELARAELAPEEKAALVTEFRNAGRRAVLYVGDGVNDGPALAAADVSVAVNTGADLAVVSAALVIPGRDLSAIPALIRLARATRRRIRTSLVFAFAYNAVMIPLAMAGGASPILAAVAMTASSITVTVYALGIRARVPESRP